jgi:hypothetical protein
MWELRAAWLPEAHRGAPAREREVRRVLPHPLDHDRQLVGSHGARALPRQLVPLLDRERLRRQGEDGLLLLTQMRSEGRGQVLDKPMQLLDLSRVGAGAPSEQPILDLRDQLRDPDVRRLQPLDQRALHGSPLPQSRPEEAVLPLMVDVEDFQPKAIVSSD